MIFVDLFGRNGGDEDYVEPQTEQWDTPAVRDDDGDDVRVDNQEKPVANDNANDVNREPPKPVEKSVDSIDVRQVAAQAHSAYYTYSDKYESS